MGYPDPAHGAELAIEKVGAASGSFTVVAHVDSSLDRTLERATKTLIQHDKNVPYVVVSPVSTLGPIEVSGTYDKAEASHDLTTGLTAHYLGVGGTPGISNTFGLRWRGSGGSAGSDEVIMSGQVSAITQENATDAEDRRFTATIMPSGPYQIDGVEYS